MITGATIAGFKRFASERFEMAPLTILTGINGSGKTSLLQTLLLVAEASRSASSTLSLNGPFGLELGTAEDVLNWQSASPIRLALESAGRPSSEWAFAVPVDEALYLEIASRPSDLPKALAGAPRAFTYLSAERLGPRGFTAASPLPETELEVGVQGEYCAHVLSVLGDRLIESVERTHPLHNTSAPRLLKYEVEQWLTEIARPIEVTGERAAGATVAELRFRTPGSTWVRSTNMGFGLTYALPNRASRSDRRDGGHNARRESRGASPSGGTVPDRGVSGLASGHWRAGPSSRPIPTTWSMAFAGPSRNTAI